MRPSGEIEELPTTGPVSLLLSLANSPLLNVNDLLINHALHLIFFHEVRKLLLDPDQLSSGDATTGAVGCVELFDCFLPLTIEIPIEVRTL